MNHNSDDRLNALEQIEPSAVAGKSNFNSAPLSRHTRSSLLNSHQIPVNRYRGLNEVSVKSPIGVALNHWQNIGDLLEPGF